MSRKTAALLKAILLAIAGTLLLTAAGSLVALFYRENLRVLECLSYLVCLIVLVLIAVGMKKRFVLRGSPQSYFRGLLVALPTFLFLAFGIVTSLVSGVQSGPTTLPIFDIVVGSIAVIFGTALTEELLHRGLILNTLLDGWGRGRRGSFIACAVVSAVLFGLVHFYNLVGMPVDKLGSALPGVTAQVISAFSSGLLYAAYYLRSGNLWVPVTLHAMQDMSAFMSEWWSDQDFTSTVMGYNVTSMLPLIAVRIALFIFLMREKKSDDYLR